MVRDARDEAERLAADGQWAAAISVLERAVDTADDPGLEMALTDLRHRAWTHLTSPEPLPPPVTEGTTEPGPTGLPEMTVGDLTGARVRAALRDHGTLLVRNAVDADAVAMLRDAVDAAFDEADRDPAERTDPGWYHPLTLDEATADRLGGARLAIPRKFARDAGGVLLADSPRTMARLLGLYEGLGLHAMATEFLGDRPVMSALKCTARKVDPDEVGGWHQDGAFLGRDIRAINLWLTLDPCGVDAPGLDIVPRRFDHIVETGTRGAYFDWAVGDALVDEITAECGVLRPRFEPGDLVIFDQMMLHRTAIAPEMTRVRHAIEFWCFAASAYPDTHVPLVW